MAPKINPSSIHLGKDQGAPSQTPADNRYFADYFPSPPKEDQPVSCALPPEIPSLFPPKLPLEPLEPSCEFTFPDVTPIPPVFNPKIELPCVCEQLEATVDIKLENFSEGSYIRLSTGGPNNCNSQEASECLINLEGFLKPPPACPSTSLDVVGRFGKAFTNSSKLNVQRKNDCEHTIIYDFDINVCETFEADVCPSGIVFGQGFGSGSNLTLSAKSAPDCGVELCGNLDLDVCVDLDVRGAVCVTGNAVTNNDLSIQRLTDNKTGGICGIEIAGCLDINACVEVGVEGDFCVKGNAVTNNDLSFSPLKNNDGEFCGVQLNGCLNINACVDTVVEGELCIKGQLVEENTLTISPISSGTDDSIICGIKVDGCVTLQDACTEFTPEINIEVLLGPEEDRAEATLDIHGPPECGFKYDRTIKVKGCPSICVEGEPLFTSTENIFGQNSLRLVPKTQTEECCGLEWQGELEIKNIFPCPDFDASIDVCSVPVELYFGLDRYGGSISFEVTKSGDKCNPVTKICSPEGLVLNMPAIPEIEPPCIPTVIVEKMCWPPDDNCGSQGCPEEGSLFVRKKYRQPFGVNDELDQADEVEDEKHKIFEIKFEDIIEIRRCATCEELRIVLYFIKTEYKLCIPDLIVKVTVADEEGGKSEEAPIKLIKKPKEGEEKKELANIDLASILYFKVINLDNCSKQLEITMRGQEIEMDVPSFELSQEGGAFTTALATTTGCAWSDTNEEDKIRLGFDENGKLELFGKLPVPCFSCRNTSDTAGEHPFEIYQIEEIDLIGVNRIIPPVGALGECCDTASENELNMCQGFLQFKFEGAGGYYCKESIEFWDEASTGTSKLDREKLTIYADDDKSQADIRGNEIRVGEFDIDHMVVLSSAGIDITAGETKAIRLRPEDLPDDRVGNPEWREIQFCDNGVTYKAYVFMTEPKEFRSGEDAPT